MTTSINAYFDNAQLALAAYALNLTQTMSREDYEAALRQAGMSNSQANRFADTYTIIEQFTDPATGLSATFFRKGGEAFLAIRGTELSDIFDLLNDLSIAVGLGARPQFNSLRGFVDSLYSSGQLAAGEMVNVSGHSLGGHLAHLLAVDMPNRVSAAYTYNAPGIGGILVQLLEYYGVAPANIPLAQIVNLVGAGPSVIAGLGTGIGQRRDIFLESNTQSIVALTESIAVYDLFAKIDPALNTTDPAVGIGKITDILKATSNNPALSLEAALDSLRKLFKDPIAPNPVSTKTADRQQFYQNLFDLQSRIPAGTLTIDSLVTISAAQLAALAQGSEAFAYRYALKELNPFAIVGDNAIYDQHNVNGEINLYDSTVGLGMTQPYLADRAEMLARLIKYNTADGNIALRSSKIETYEFIDKTLKGPSGNDLAITVVGTQPQSISNPVRIVFGSGEGETIAGGEVAVGDHLFGGGGDDTLIGNGGNDYLEGNADSDTLEGGFGRDTLIGGAGNDILEGGEGSDTLEGGKGGDSYIYRNGDGVDTINDSDGLGIIRFFTGPSTWSDLRGGKKKGDNLWQSEDERFTYSLNTETDGSYTLSINNAGGTLFVTEFVDGKLGINLEEAPTPIPTPPGGGREILGIYAPQIFNNPPDLNSPPPGYSYLPITSTEFPFDYVLMDDLGNLVRDPTRPWLGNPQELFGSEGSDYILGSGFGNAMGGKGGDDHIQGGLSLDSAGGGDGNDFIEGGAFADVPLEDWLNVSAPFPEGEIRGASDDRLFGMAGNDVIFGGTAADMGALLDPTAPSAGHKGDWIAGEKGDDQLYGSTGHDVLLGGSGKDLMVGGPGDDVLDGDDSFATSHTTNPAAGGWMWRIDIGSSPFDIRFFPVSVMPWLDWSDSYYKLGGDDDILLAGSGNDILIGMLGNDTLLGEDGDDILSGWEGSDTLLGGAGDDVMAGDFGGYEQPNDRLVGFTHSVPAGFLDVNTGDSGLVDQAGNDYLDGDAGSDTLYGEGGNDIVLGGDGNDTLWGDAAYLPAVLHGGDYLDGGAGDDHLRGQGGADTLIGGAGNDVLEGGDGGDIYVYTRGDGEELIVEQGVGGVDVLVVSDYALADVTVRWLANGSARLTGSNGDEITISRMVGDTSPGIELVQFADGTNLSIAEIAAQPIAEDSIGGDGWTTLSDQDDTVYTFEIPINDPSGFVMVDAGPGNDTVYGSFNAVVFGNDGDDTLFGGDTLLGGDGNDNLAGAVTLIGGPGDDQLLDGEILSGGPGSDLLDGGFGPDRYLLRVDELGQDTIADSHGLTLEQFAGWYYPLIDIPDWQSRLFDPLTENIASIEEGIALGLLPALPQIAAHDWSTLAPLYASGVIQADAVEFAQGLSAGDLSLSWGEVSSISPVSGALEAYTTLDVSWGLGNLARIVIPHAEDPLGTGVEEFRFADGSVVSMQEMVAAAQPAPSFDPQFGDNVLVGSARSEVIFGWAGNDTLEGGPGGDSLGGGEGNDVYVFAQGDGVDYVFDEGGADRVRFAGDITPEDVLVTADLFGALVLTLTTGDSVTLANWFNETTRVESVEFADGTIWDTAELGSRITVAPATEFDDFIGGTPADDVIDGLGGNDQINGFGGDDVLEGSAGNDLLQGGAGSDILRGGDGADALSDEQGNNFFDGGTGVDVIHAYGTPYNALGGSNFVIGGTDNDWIYSLAADNVIAFNTGDGQDTVYALYALTLSLGAGIDPSSLSLSQDGADLVLAISASDSIRLTRQFEPDPQAWPQITMQLFGSVHFYDFSAVINDFYQAVAADPSLVEFPLNGVLPGHETGSSETQALGGALAYQYGTLGTLDSLSDAAIRQVLTNPDFGTASQSIEIQGGNQTPTLDSPIADQTAPEDAAFSFTLPAGTFVDADAGDTLAFSAALADSSALPGWLSFDGATQSFSGTPLNDDVGALDITVTATDAGGLSASDTFTLTVANVNDAPVVASAIADQIAQEDAAFGFALPPTTFTDVDAGDTLSLSASLAEGTSLPAWLSFDAATHTFSGTPTNADVGTISVRVTATDGSDASVSDVFDLMVTNTNDAPVLANTIADQVATEDAAFSFMVPANTFADADVGDALTYSATLANGSALPAWLSFNSITRTFSGTPTNEDVGVIGMKVTATDGENASVSDVFDLVIANTNDTPVAAADGVAVNEDATTANLAPLLLANDTDVDAGDTRCITAVDTTGTVGTVSFDAATQALTYAADAAAQDALAAGATATDQFSYTVADAARASSTATVSVTVSGVNDAPALVTPIGNRNAAANQAFTFQVPDSSFADVDTGDTLAYSATLADSSPLPGWLGFEPATRTFTGTPGNADIGTLSVEVSATDIHGASASAVFDIGITPAGILGTDGDDNLTGTAIDDAIFGLNGNDALDGLTGADLLDGGAGNDTLRYSADAVWGSGFSALNQGSPGHAGSGQSVALIGRNRTHDVYHGGDGFDRLSGTAGSDAIFLDDALSPAPGGVAGPRLENFEIISMGNGNDVVDLTSSVYAYGNVTVDGGAGDDVLWASLGDDLLFGGSGNDSMDGGAGDDTLAGGAGSDTLVGGAGNDTLDGGTGIDTMRGGAGDDTYVVDGTNLFFVTIADTVSELANEGIDTVQSSVTYSLGSNVEHLILTGTATINGTGNGLNNLLRGNSAANTLAGAAGNDVLEGGGGNDTLSDTGGANLFNGQAGTDTLTGNTGNELFVGGAGNDTINTGAGADIIAFNRGDGTDTAAVSTAKDNSVSLGGGIAYADLFFVKSGNNLVLKTAGAAGSEGITFTNWYATAANRSVLNMQMIVEASADFDAGSADALRNKKVAEFNFDGLVGAFDAARAANPALTSWALTNALTSFHLSGSDTAALGGDLAYQHGRFGNLANVGTVGAQNVLGGAQFGSAIQNFQPLTSLQEGLVRLS